MQPCVQEDRISKIEDAVTRIEKSVNQMSEELKQLKETLTARVDDHQAALYGDREHTGILGQMKVLEELAVALKGYGQEPGLIATIKTLSCSVSEWNDAKKWMIRLVIGEIIVAILALILK